MNKKWVQAEFNDFMSSVNKDDSQRLTGLYSKIAAQDIYACNKNLNDVILGILKNDCRLNIKGDITIGKLKWRGVKVEVINFEGCPNVVDIRIKQRGNLLYNTKIANFL